MKILSNIMGFSKNTSSKMRSILCYQYNSNIFFYRQIANKVTGNLEDVTRDRIDGYVKSNNVVVFMKGTQQQPMCGFSNNVKRVAFFVNSFEL